MKTAAHISTPCGQACRPIGSVKAGKVASWKQGAAPGPLRRITSQALSVDGLQKRRITATRLSALRGSSSFADQPRVTMLRPVISAGCSSPMRVSMVGATSASTPPSRMLSLRLPT